MSVRNVITGTTKRLLSFKSMSLCNRREQSLWTIDKIVKSPHKDIEIPRRTINDHIWENLEKWADKTALVSVVYALYLNISFFYFHLFILWRAR